MNNLNLVVSRFGEEIFQYGFLKVEQWVGESWEQFRAKSLLVFLYRLFYFLLTLSLLMEVADFFFPGDPFLNLSQTIFENSPVAPNLSESES